MTATEETTGDEATGTAPDPVTEPTPVVEPEPGETKRRGMKRSTKIALIVIGVLALALWWAGGQVGPMAGIPGWLPLAVTAAGAVLAIAPGFRRR